MQLFKAFYAFYHALFYRECEHKRVTAMPGQAHKACYCPDCGYKVAIMWTICRCRTCGAKRYPRQTIDGRVSSLYRYCQHCGQADYQIIKRDKINAYEMPYAILTREIDYSEEKLTRPRPAHNPFKIHSRLDIVDGEVLSKQETFSSAAAYGFSSDKGWA